MTKNHKVIGVLLAGGLSRRMGFAGGSGHKCLLELHGKPLLRHVIERAAPQVDGLVLNANDNLKTFKGFGLPVVQDTIQGYAGPLAGILAGMEWARENVKDAEWLASFATDAPFIPEDMVARFLEAAGIDGSRGNADVVVATSRGRTHPVFALWRLGLAEALRTAMKNEAMRKIDAWTARYKVAEVAFDAAGLDPFFNINRPEDLKTVEGRQLS